MSAETPAPSTETQPSDSQSSDSKGAKPKSAWARLPWYDRLWAALPLMLVMRGGLIGGMCGGLAWFLNEKVLTAPGSRPMKYLLCLLIDAGAVVLFLVIAIPVAQLMRR